MSRSLLIMAVIAVLVAAGLVVHSHWPAEARGPVAPARRPKVSTGGDGTAEGEPKAGEDSPESGADRAISPQ